MEYFATMHQVIWMILLRDVLSDLSFAIPVLPGTRIRKQRKPIFHVNAIDLPHNIAGQVFFCAQYILYIRRDACEFGDLSRKMQRKPTIETYNCLL